MTITFDLQSRIDEDLTRFLEGFHALWEFDEISTLPSIKNLLAGAFAYSLLDDRGDEFSENGESLDASQSCETLDLSGDNSESVLSEQDGEPHSEEVTGGICSSDSTKEAGAEFSGFDQLMVFLAVSHLICMDEDFSVIENLEKLSEFSTLFNKSNIQDKINEYGYYSPEIKDQIHELIQRPWKEKGAEYLVLPDFSLRVESKLLNTHSNHSN